MPANLTPEYLAAEKQFRAAKTDPERLICLEHMLRVIPKHKGTDKMQGDLKRRISKLKEKLEQQTRSKKKGFSYRIHKEGAGTVGLIGPPNVGKSRLFQTLSGVEAKIGDYPFTTLEPHPGMMAYEDVQIQLVDFPPVSVEHTENWVFDLIKSCDVFLLVIDLKEGNPLEQLQTTLDLLEQRYLLPLWDNQPVDAGHRVARRGLIVANKLDTPAAEETLGLFRDTLERPLPWVAVSAAEGKGIEGLRHRIYELLNIMRIYSKTPGKKADLEAPYAVRRGATLIEFAEVVHQDFAHNLKFGKVWGSTKFDGMIVKRDYVLEEGDIVELHV